MNDQTMKELGAYLRWKRKEKGKSLDDVVNETRLRAETVKAMEDGVLRDLPAGVYARGMVKIYLEYLGANELLPQYEEFLDRRKPETPQEPPFTKPAVTRGFKRRDNRWIVALLALAVLVAGYLLWQQKGTLRQAIDRKAQQATVEAQIKESEPKQPVPALPSPVSSSVIKSLESSTGTYSYFSVLKLSLSSSGSKPTRLSRFRETLSAVSTFLVRIYTVASSSSAR